jgi:hypothetical protein
MDTINLLARQRAYDLLSYAGILALDREHASPDSVVMTPTPNNLINPTSPSLNFYIENLMSASPRQGGAFCFKL